MLRSPADGGTSGEFCSLRLRNFLPHVLVDVSMAEKKVSKDLLAIETADLDSNSPFLINRPSSNKTSQPPEFKFTSSSSKERAASFLAQINHLQDNVDAQAQSIETNSDCEDNGEPKIELNLLLFKREGDNLEDDNSSSSSSESSEDDDSSTDEEDDQ